MLETTILETLVKLPDSLKQEVLHYIEFLAAKYANNEVTINPPQKKRQAGMMKDTFVLPLIALLAGIVTSYKREHLCCNSASG